MDDNYSVYRLSFPNGKSYIGITRKQLHQRWKNGLGYQHYMPVRKAINHYGWDLVTKECLYCGLSREDAESKEIELIAKFNSMNRDFGYNILPGGNLSRTNVEVSQITRERLSKAGMGRVVTAETKRRIGLKNSGENSSCYGKKLSAEHIAKIVATKMRNGKRKRKIVQIDKHTNEVIKVWDSGIDFERETGLCRKHIPSACRGKRETTQGFKWRYAD